MVLDKLSEERHDIPVNKKGILAVSAMTRAYRPALNSMDKGKESSHVEFVVYRGGMCFCFLLCAAVQA